MKKILFFSILFISFTLSNLNGQTRLIGERGIYSQAYINPVLINPGAAGFQDYQEIIFNYRNTWATFPGSPKTMTFNYNGPLGNRLGLGAQILTDRFAAFETLKGALTLSYSIESDVNKVGFGLTGEYVQHRLDGVSGVGSDLIQLDDSEIINRLDGSNYLDASFGVYGVYDKTISYGLTIPSFISSRLTDLFTENEPSNEFGFIAMVGYKMDMADKDVVLEPSIIAKSLMHTPFHVDVNLKASFLDESLIGGVTYTAGGENRLGFLIGAKLNNFMFNYSYGLSFHDFQQYNNGSHEFSVKLNLQPQSKKMVKAEELIENDIDN